MTITHPHHPLRGQPCEIVRIRRGVDPDLVVRFPDGSHAAIAMSWTDYAGAPEEDLVNPDLSLLDLSGLRQVVQLLERIRQEGRFPRTRRASQPPSSRRSCQDGGD